MYEIRSLPYQHRPLQYSYNKSLFSGDWGYGKPNRQDGFSFNYQSVVRYGLIVSGYAYTKSQPSSPFRIAVTLALLEIPPYSDNTPVVSKYGHERFFFQRSIAGHITIVIVPDTDLLGPASIEIDKFRIETEHSTQKHSITYLRTPVLSLRHISSN